MEEVFYFFYLGYGVELLWICFSCEIGVRGICNSSFVEKFLEKIYGMLGYLICKINI